MSHKEEGKGRNEHAAHLTNRLATSGEENKRPGHKPGQRRTPKMLTPLPPRRPGSGGTAKPSTINCACCTRIQAPDECKARDRFCAKCRTQGQTLDSPYCAARINHYQRREAFQCSRCTRTHRLGECVAVHRHCTVCGTKGHTPDSHHCESHRGERRAESHEGNPGQVNPGYPQTRRHMACGPNTSK